VLEETPPTTAPPDGLVTQPLDDVVDSDAFIPRLLALLSNALVWRESMLLRREFSLGTNDWRVLSALGVRPGSSATDVSEFLVMNKAVVSKAVNVLISRHLIASTEGPRGSRHLFLTPAGAEMHDRMLPISLAGEDILLSQLSPAEVIELKAILGKLMTQIPRLANEAT
jgi:DNA-binding MarR family transcriptional regulator